MADISAFPTIVNGVIHNSGPTWSFTATEATKAGQVVGPAATGVSNAVVIMDATAGETGIGVAIKSVIPTGLATFIMVNFISECTYR